MNDSSEDLFGALGQLAQAECPHCGAVTSGYSTECEQCGQRLDHLPDDVSLDVLAGGQRRVGLHKVSMEEARNLRQLREAREGLANGSMPEEAYLTSVEEIASIVGAALDLYASPWFVGKQAKMPKDAAKVYADIAAGAREMMDGLDLMRAYETSRSLDDVDAGLARFESGLWKVDVAQDVALQKAAEFEAAREE